MALNLSPTLRDLLWDQQDWSSATGQIAEQITEDGDLEPATKAGLLRELAELCQFCVLDPQPAADLYGACYQADRSQTHLLARMRHLCELMGRSDLVARTAELEFRQTNEARFQAIAGQAWLDFGDPDRALKPLLAANADSPGNPHLVAALEVARREWATPESRAEALLADARKRSDKTPIQALQAVRIFRMLGTIDSRYEEGLQLCLAVVPNLPSACKLMEAYLFEAERLDELAEHFRRRGQAAPTPVMAARFYLHGSSLLFRAAAGEQAGPLFMAGLEKAAVAELDSVSGLLAQLRALAASSARERKQVVEIAERFYEQLASADEQVGIAIFCAQIAWLAQKDHTTATRWIDRLQGLCSSHPLVASFLQG